MQVADAERLKNALRCGRSNCECRRGNVHCPAHEDNHPSFTVSEKNGTVLVHCQSGCSQETVIDALKARDLWTTEKPHVHEHKHVKRPPRTGSPTAIYPYTDEIGTLVLQVLRWPDLPDGGKDFSQRKPGKNGGWVYTIGDIERVPYHLPEVVSAAAKGRTILIPEGEKDVDRLRSLGCIATCNVGGAKKWMDRYSEYLRGAACAILPDNDTPGQEHALQVAKSLFGKARLVKIVKLPGLEAKEDVSDWLDSGGSLEELIRLVKEAPAYAPSGAELRDTFAETDLGNAERLVQWHGQNLRYCYEMGKWFVWCGSCWQTNEARVRQFAKATARAIYEEAANAPGSEKRRTLARHAHATEANSKIEAMLKCSQSEEGVAVTINQTDADPWLLNVGNGLLNLQTGQLGQHRREALCMKQITWNYDEDAQCPEWEAFLETILPIEDTRLFVQRAAGYSLTGLTDERKMFILHGTGRNGKSTLVETIARLLGNYAVRTPTSTIMMKKDGGIPNDLARLIRIRFVHASETEEGRRLAESVVKDITGGDTISARFLNQEWFDFKPEFKIWLGTNHKPVIVNTDDAIWDRLPTIPFTVRIPEDQIVPRSEWDKRFTKEMPGILSWAVRGCLEWARNGLGVPLEVLDATDAYRAAMDILGEFLSEICVLSHDYAEKTSSLYAAYAEWCKNTGELCLNQRTFNARLEERGFTPKHTNTGKRWPGIGLKPKDSLL